MLSQRTCSTTKEVHVVLGHPHAVIRYGQVGICAIALDGDSASTSVNGFLWSLAAIKFTILQQLTQAVDKGGNACGGLNHLGRFC
jgi:hypothetical protein